MGACCSSKSSAVNTSQLHHRLVHSPNASTVSTSFAAVSNALHGTYCTECIPMIIKNAPEITAFKQSMMVTPPADELQAQCWIQKRGHVIRNWRKRYCVLGINKIQYYTQSSPEPPYGKHQKGSVALFGAICITKESEDFNAIHVEIYGNRGQKDLFFTVDNNEEGQEFVRMIQWAIRRTTLAVQIRNAKTTASWKNSNSEDKNSGDDWSKHNEILFDDAVKSLKIPQLYEFVTVDPDGAIIIRPGAMRLWTVFGDSFLPTVQTDADKFGLAIHIWQRGKPTFNVDMADEQCNILTFEDITDLSFQYIDMESTNMLRPNVQKFLHPLCSGSTGRYLIVTIKSEFGVQYHFLTCCLHGYDDTFSNIQNIALFIQTRKKMKEACGCVQSDKEIKVGVMAAVKLMNE